MWPQFWMAFPGSLSHQHSSVSPGIKHQKLSAPRSVHQQMFGARESWPSNYWLDVSPSTTSRTPSSHLWPRSGKHYCFCCCVANAGRTKPKGPMLGRRRKSPVVLGKRNFEQQFRCRAAPMLYHWQSQAQVWALPAYAVLQDLTG